jgi:antibiotic biosynthesis monooxygenase (ABM) superfamily enzyme
MFCFVICFVRIASFGDILHGGNISSVRFVINRFADQASLDAWEISEVALSLLEEVSKFSTRQRVIGLETWFYLPNLKSINILFCALAKAK